MNIEKSYDVAGDAVRIAVYAENRKGDAGNANGVFTEMLKAYMMGTSMSGRGIGHYDGLFIQALQYIAKNATEGDPSSDNATHVARLMVTLLAAEARNMENKAEPATDGELTDYMKGIDPINTPVSEALGAGLGLVGTPTPANQFSRSTARRSGAELFVEMLQRNNMQFEALEGVEWPESWSIQDREAYIQYVRPLQQQHIEHKRKMAATLDRAYGQSVY